MQNIVDRACQRVRINKGISYNGLDIHSRVIDRYMGVALDVCQNGIQIETNRMITAEHILLMFFDYNSHYIATNGRVVYSNKDKTGNFKTGIHLQGTKEDNLQFVKRLIKSYHYQKRVPIYIS
jgi:Tfp pilus assembly protein PilZ